MDITRLKIDYLINISLKTSSISSGCFLEPTQLEEFAVKCLRTFKETLAIGHGLPATDNQPGDEACLLGVTATVWLSRFGVGYIDKEKVETIAQGNPQDPFLI